MKKYLILILFSFIASFIFGQSNTPPVVPRSGPAITVSDARVKPGLNFYIPIVSDTTNGLNGGLDSLGALIQIRSTGSIFKRDTITGGHRWRKILDGSDTAHLRSDIDAMADSLQIPDTINYELPLYVSHGPTGDTLKIKHDSAIWNASSIGGIPIIGTPSDGQVLYYDATASAFKFKTITGSDTSPEITVNPTSLSGFSTTEGTASSSKSVSVSGTHLDDDIVISGTDNWEVSLSSGSGYGDSVILEVSDGTVGSTTVYYRIKSTASSGSPSETSDIISGDITETVDLTGTISESASLSASPSSITGLNGTEGTAGTSQIVTVTFSGTTITATAPTNTEISKDGGSTYSSSQSFSSGSPLALKIRTTAAASAGSVSGNLNLSGSGVTDVNVPISGTVSSSGGGGAVAKFSFSLTSKSCSGWTNIFGDPHLSTLTGTDAGTGITFTSVATANWTPNSASAFDGNGTTSGTFFSDCSGTSTAVMNNGWVNAVVYDHTKPQVQLGGLNPAKTYTIALTGSTNGGSLRKTDVYVEGDELSSVQSFNAKSNTANGATFTGIAPDASGNIKIYVCANTASPEQGHMDAFTITEED